MTTRMTTGIAIAEHSLQRHRESFCRATGEARADSTSVKYSHFTCTYTGARNGVQNEKSPDGWSYGTSASGIVSEHTVLYCYGRRLYSPGIGKWISRDPIEEEGGLNPYGFVGNSPVMHLDPHGLAFVVFVSTENPPAGPNNSSEMTAVDGIKIVRRDMVQQGLFESPLNNSSVAQPWVTADERGNACKICVPLWIELSTRLVEGPVRGVKYTYDEHTVTAARQLEGGSGGPSLPEPPPGQDAGNGIKAEAEAHEKGHLKAYWEVAKPCIERDLAPLRGTLADLEEVKRICYECDRQSQAKGAQYSNEATRKYYNETATHMQRLHPSRGTGTNTRGDPRRRSYMGGSSFYTDMWIYSP